jgi:hypothetical protein
MTVIGKEEEEGSPDSSGGRGGGKARMCGEVLLFFGSDTCNHIRTSHLSDGGGNLQKKYHLGRLAGC